MRKAAFFSMFLLIPPALAAGALSAGRDAIPGVAGTVWAVERLDGARNTLTAFDAATGDVLGVATVGQRPIGVAAPVGTGKVYTADERSNQLSVFSKADFVAGRRVARRIQMGAFPHHMMASPDGRLIYVAEYGTHKIGVVDTRIDERVDGFYASGNPAAKTHAVWITADGKDLYAANEGATTSTYGTFSKLDAATGRRLWEAPLGVRPSEVLVTPNGKTAYLTVRNENRLKIFDLSGDRPVATGDLDIGVQPDTMQLTNDGKTLVVGLRSVPQMALVDTQTLGVRRISFAGHGISGHQWLSPDGRYTFIALESTVTNRPGAIGVVENASASIVATWPYPAGPWPHGVVYEPQVLGSAR